MNSLTGNKSGSRIKIIIPDEFGQKGEIIQSLPLNSSATTLKKALLKANEPFIKTIEKKNDQDHVRKGRIEGIEWTMPIELGEDRDGDGKFGHGGGRPQQGARSSRPALFESGHCWSPKCPYF